MIITDPRVVTPEEAQVWVDDPVSDTEPLDRVDLTYTVATEDHRWAERIAAAERAAVVKALRETAEVFRADGRGLAETEAVYCDERAVEIENGAPL